VEVKALYETFLSLNPEGKVDKETFKKGLIKLESAGLKNLQDTPFSDRLFHLLDSNNDGTVDLGEFVCGLSMLCKGSVEEKLERTSQFHSFTSFLLSLGVFCSMDYNLFIYLLFFLF